MKFLNSYWREPNMSIVEIEHLCGFFRGVAKVHPDDEDMKSSIIGYEIAETRAKIKALQYERRLEKEKYKECQDFVKACECYKDFDKSSPTARIMYRQLNRRKRKIGSLTATIKSLKEGIITGLEERERVLEKLRAIKENKDKKD